MRRLIYMLMFCAGFGCAGPTPSPIATTGNAIARADARRESITDHAATIVKIGGGETKYHGESIVKEASAQKKDLAEAQSDLATVAKQLAAALSANVKTFHMFQLGCVAVVGLCVVGLIFGVSGKLSVAGIVSAVVMAAGAQVLINLNAVSVGHGFWGTVYLVAGVSLAWLLIEWQLRGSFMAAVRTNPIQDIQDLLNRHVAAGNLSAPTDIPPDFGPPAPPAQGEAGATA